MVFRLTVVLFLLCKKNIRSGKLERETYPSLENGGGVPSLENWGGRTLLEKLEAKEESAAIFYSA